MERNEQKYAQALFDGLSSRFAGPEDRAHVGITGGGVQWRCFAQRGGRSCWTGCFDAGGPEFLTFFEEDSRKVATARTSSQADTIEAIRQWLDEAPVPALYEHFRFVDVEKRKLLLMRECMLKNFPDLCSGTRHEVTVNGTGGSHLWFRTDTRAAHIHLAPQHDCPEASFFWDGCELFHFDTADCTGLGAVLSRWLAGNAPPSSLRREFPWLEIGQLADYYEKGNPVEGEFVESWNRMERVYEESRFLPREVVLPFIGELRQAGYDRRLRAGEAIWSLIVSRSRRPKLRPEQPLVSFQFHGETMEVFSSSDGEERIPELPIAKSETVDRVLEKLAAQPVD